MDNSPYGDISPFDHDMMVRTVMGEAGSDPASQPGVAAVIANRMRASGQSAANVVLAHGQFEPWASRPRELMSYSPDSSGYKSAAQVVDGILSGGIPDPTNGADKFYAPAAQAALGRPPPAWDDGSGIDIGRHRFFGGTQVAAAPLSSTGFLTDFPLAGPGGSPAAATPAASVPTAPPVPPSSIRFMTPDEMSKITGGAPPASPSFFSDFPLAKPGASPDPAPQPPVTPIGVNDAVRATATGVPILGGTLNRADAALDAFLAPAMNRFFSPENQLQGDTYGERYTNALAIQNGMDANFAAQHPVANKALQIGGGVAGTVPAIMAAPAAFGATSAGLVPNMAMGAVGGALMGGADAAVRSDGDINALKWGAGTGGLFGALGPPIGKLVGSGVNALSDAFSRTTPAARNVASVLTDIGMSPGQAQNALTRMGPNATLADIDPALTTEAGGLASLGGAPTSILKTAMGARAAQADNRVATAIDQHLGPKPDLEASLDSMLDQGRQAAAPHYAAARATAGPMDVQPLVSDLDQRIAQSTGGVADTLRTLRGYLVRDVPGFGTMPKDDPQQLLGARQAIDDLIERRGTAETTAGRNALGQAQYVRSNLDAILKQDPNIAAGDAAFSHQMQLRESMQEGTQLFTRGVRPEDFQRQLAQMTPEQVGAYRSGARVAIGDALEQARRGELSGAQSMFGRSSANRAKLDALFPHSGDVFDMLQGEAAMRATEQRVAQNSATAERQAVQAKYAPVQGSALSAAPAVIGEAIGGGPGAIGLTALRAAYGSASNALSQAARDRLIQGTARGLSALGPDQQAFMGQLSRAYRSNAATNALAEFASRGANVMTHVGGNALQQYLPTYPR